MFKREKFRKKRIGTVARNSMDKSAMVFITSIIEHPIYGKRIKRVKKVMVHDENNECHIGDAVLIMETRPLSKHKHWRLVKVLGKNNSYDSTRNDSQHSR